MVTLSTQLPSPVSEPVTSVIGESATVLGFYKQYNQLCFSSMHEMHTTVYMAHVSHTHAVSFPDLCPSLQRAWE